MGADFLMAWFAVPVKRADQVNLDFEGALDHIRNTDWSSNWEIVDEFENFANLDEEGQAGKDRFNEQARKELEKAVEEMKWLKTRREVGWLEHKDEVVFISGGMSWGDLPTEFYRTLELISKSGLDKILITKHHGTPEQATGKNGITLKLPINTRIAVKSIHLEQAEGLCQEPVTVNTFAEADAYLQRIADHRRNWTDDPSGEILGYMKTDCKVEWQDGKVWQGRYDVNYQECCSLAEDIRQCWHFEGGLLTDGELKQREWTRPQYLKLLRTRCELTPEQIANNAACLDKYALD
ncbi:MAG: hypothetical protein BroJett014_11470 [Planctomycetota bacterium]|nr:hypothetical protein [Planctomycetota bacterium]GIK52174.1 MAG: hypothetical protein BroJett014_11470 [Planctomycetota bacterium]